MRIVLLIFPGRAVKRMSPGFTLSILMRFTPPSNHEQYLFFIVVIHDKRVLVCKPGLAEQFLIRNAKFLGHVLRRLLPNQREQFLARALLTAF